MKRRYRRTPKFYDGRYLTSHQLQDLLPVVLHRVSEAFSDRPDLIITAWKQIIGPAMEGMTEAVSFSEGLLVVKVKNSTLYALLRQYERAKLLKKLRERFPRTEIKNIIFRVG